MINDSIKVFRNTSSFISFKSASPDFLNLPNEIKVSTQFCLWKYKYVKHSIKLAKVPYGYSKENRNAIPSLKNKNYWFTFGEYLNFKDLLPDDFNLGLVLTDGPFTVIDIDNYQSHKALDNIWFKMLKKGVYIEVSPSGTGLHIFYKGKWPYNRKKSIFSIGHQTIKMTCEVYCGHDVRFITLTGQAVALRDNYKALVSELDLKEEIINLAEIFFGYDVFGDMCNSLEKPTAILQQSSSPQVMVENKASINEEYDQIRTQIFASNLKQRYCNLCENMNPGYKSISEADWAFAQIVSRFIKCEVKYKKQILEFFLRKDRPYRAKKNRSDYINRTVAKILSSLVQKNTNIESIAYLNKNSDYTCVDTNLVLRVCNIMKIFHFGKSVKNFQYVYSGNNNYIKASIPLSLNQNDFVNYIAILQQFAEYMRCYPNMISNDDYIQINVRKILQSFGKHDSGRSYKRFMNTVKKLAHTTIEYDKQINTNGLRSKKVGNLLMYEYRYQKSMSMRNDYLHKKLFIKMHPSTIDILQEAKYNYSIFNYKSFLTIHSNELKLLYYYFCLSTLPGYYSCKFSFNDLLKFWPESQNRSTLFKRKQNLSNLLDKFYHIQHEIPDIKISLEKDINVIVEVVVKKKQLKLI